jgi:hypothetical protein
MYSSNKCKSRMNTSSIKKICSPFVHDFSISKDERALTHGRLDLTVRRPWNLKDRGTSGASLPHITLCDVRACQTGPGGGGDKKEKIYWLHGTSRFLYSIMQQWDMCNKTLVYESVSWNTQKSVCSFMHFSNFCTFNKGQKNNLCAYVDVIID